MYRIQYLDPRGSRIWSPTVKVEREGPVAIRLQPNPASEWIEIDAAETAIFRLMDLQGRILLSGDLAIGRSRIALPSLPAGLYLLEADSESQHQSWKLLIQAQVKEK